jgi:hypothetical protein
VALYCGRKFVRYDVPNVPNGAEFVLAHLVHLERDIELRREILSDMVYQMVQNWFWRIWYIWNTALNFGEKFCWIWRTKCSKLYRIGFGTFGTFGT